VGTTPNATPAASSAATPIRRALDGFYGALMALAALAMITAFACVVLGIADRQFALGLRGLDAYAGYAIASALFLALPGTLQRGEHIRVTLVLQRLSQRWQKALQWWSLGLGVVLSVFVAYYACRLLWLSHLTNDVSQGSDATPLWIPQIGMALGCIGLAVAFVDAAWSHGSGGGFEKVDSGEAVRME
jgi:TRAP-type C4-dicarboxylate transport system permease small subunit